MKNTGKPVRKTTDRRSRARFSLGLAAKCRCTERRFRQTVLGEVVNMSSTGLLFRAAETLVPGRNVKAIINWPARLDKRVQLYLVIEGQVVRSAGDCTAIRIDRHEFRTRGAGDTVAESS